MNDYPLISVIVPVYNVEFYIEKCIESIINQTYENLEIILIDDGSTDESPLICKKYAELDRRVKLIRQQNHGLSAARNTGIKNANGHFLGFIDSDDFIHPQMYEILLLNLYNNDADLSICSLTNVYDNKNEYILNDFEKISYENQLIMVNNKKEAYKRLYDEWSLRTVIACNKLYRKEIFDNIHYPTGKIHEDEFVIHHIIGSINKIVFTNASLYYYLQRENSIINEHYSLKRLSAIEAYEDRILYFRRNKEDHVLVNAYVRYLSLIAIHYNYVKKYFPFEKEILNNLKSKFVKTLDNNKKILSPMERYEFRMFLFSNVIYKIILKLKSYKNNLIKSIS